MTTKRVSSTPGIRSLKSWLEQVGITPTTAWRHRKAGWIKTINICGRVYVTDEAIAEYVRRAQAGEFAKQHTLPEKYNSPRIAETKTPPQT